MFGASDDQTQSTTELKVHEINAMIPRKVRLDPDGGYAAAVAVLLLLGIGLVWFGGLAYYLAQQSRHREALNREGRETIAKVTKLTHGRGTTYARYTFRLGSADYEGKANLEYQDEPKWSNGQTKYVGKGDPITILFLPSDPSINYPSGWAWWSVWDVPPHLFAMIFPTMGIVALGLMFRERRLARVGWVTEGKVIACAPKGKRFRVDYEFYTEDHELFDGANENSEEYEDGSNVRVIYLRKNPKRNDTYPLTSFHTLGE